MICKVRPPARTELTSRQETLNTASVGGPSLKLFFEGMSWEQDVNQPCRVSYRLSKLYSFALASTFQKCIITGNNAPDINGEYLGEFSFSPSTPNQEWNGANDTYFLRYVILGEGTFKVVLTVLISLDPVTILRIFSSWSNIIYPLNNMLYMGGFWYHLLFLESPVVYAIPFRCRKHTRYEYICQYQTPIL